MTDLFLVLAARDGDSSELIWIIAVLIISVVGAIAGKIKERAQKPPPRTPRPPVPRPSERAEQPLPPSRRVPPSPSAPPGRPMPRVPRQPAPARHQPPVVRAPEPAPMPRSARPTPPKPPTQRRPVVRPPATRPAPAPSVQEVPRRLVEIGATLLEPTSTRAAHALVDATTAAQVREGRRRRGTWGLSRSTLRQAIVLKEVLGPPLALRRDEPSF